MTVCDHFNNLLNYYHEIILANFGAAVIGWTSNDCLSRKID